ncbi:MAG: monovalent cation/H(+) antiporter subunit G [Chloroflexota bacterium]
MRDLLIVLADTIPVIITLALLITGTALMVIAGIGLVRMPDLFLRMSTATKASTLGAGLCLLAAAVHFGDFGVSSRAIAIIFFLLLTAPVAAHMIGRAAYVDNAPLWDGTHYDHLEGQYDVANGELASYPIDTTDGLEEPGV